MDMSFDLVQTVASWPYLAVAALVECLPLGTCVVLSHSSVYSVASLCRARVWRNVVVGGPAVPGVLNLSAAEFGAMVEAATPPPSRVHRLTLHLEHEGVECIEWMEYLAAHVASLTLCTGGSARNHMAVIHVLKNLDQVPNLVGFLLGRDPVGAAYPSKNLSWMRLPDGLKVLRLRCSGGCQPEVAARVHVPQTVEELELWGRVEAPRDLPVLPHGLKTLIIRGHIHDFGPFVGLVPKGCTRLVVEAADHQPVQILGERARLLGSVLHNLVVA